MHKNLAPSGLRRRLHRSLVFLLLFQRQNHRLQRRRGSRPRGHPALLHVPLVDRPEAVPVRHLPVCAAPRVVRDLEADHRPVRRPGRAKRLQSSGAEPHGEPGGDYVEVEGAQQGVAPRQGQGPVPAKGGAGEVYGYPAGL